MPAYKSEKVKFQLSTMTLKMNSRSNGCYITKGIDTFVLAAYKFGDFHHSLGFSQKYVAMMISKVSRVINLIAHERAKRASEL